MGLGFRALGLGFRVLGFGLRVFGLGFRVLGLGLRDRRCEIQLTYTTAPTPEILTPNFSLIRQRQN